MSNMKDFDKYTSGELSNSDIETIQNEIRDILYPFKSFNKIPRFSKETMIITEKLDGTNGLIYISDDLTTILAGSRHKWIHPGKTTDNYGFAAWVAENKEELRRLGPGYHYGEWYGQGIQRRYDLQERRFALFNTNRWVNPESRPKCCECVPVLYDGPFDIEIIRSKLAMLKLLGSQAAPGFKNPEGIIVFLKQINKLYKVLSEDDNLHKFEGYIPGACQ